MVIVGAGAEETLPYWREANVTLAEAIIHNNIIAGYAHSVSSLMCTRNSEMTSTFYTSTQ